MSTARRCRRTCSGAMGARSATRRAPLSVPRRSPAHRAPGHRFYVGPDHEPRWDPPLAGGAGPTSARRRVVDQLVWRSLGDLKAVCYSPKGQFGSLASRAVDALEPSIPTPCSATQRRCCAIPSVTGQERPVLEALAELAAAHGLDADLHAARPGAPARAPGPSGRGGAARRAVGPDGHAAGRRAGAAVPERARRRRRARHRAVAARPVVGRARGRPPARPRRGRHEGRRGRRAARAGRRCGAPAAPTIVLQCVASEEDGGLGTFAALERDAAFDAALIPEPTGLRRRVRAGGRAHLPVRRSPAAPRTPPTGSRAARRSTATCACTRRCRRSSARVNADVAHPLMRELELPYPLLVGRVERRRVVEPGARPRGVRGPPRRARRRRPGGGPRRAGGRRGGRARRRRGAGRGALDGRRVPARRDAAGPPVGGGRGRPRSRPSAGGRRGASASRGAPTCACSRRAASRA